MKNKYTFLMFILGLSIQIERQIDVRATDYNSLDIFFISSLLSSQCPCTITCLRIIRKYYDTRHYTTQVLSF